MHTLSNRLFFGVSLAFSFLLLLQWHWAVAQPEAETILAAAYWAAHTDIENMENLLCLHSGRQVKLPATHINATPVSMMMFGTHFLYSILCNMHSLWKESLPFNESAICQLLESTLAYDKDVYHQGVTWNDKLGVHKDTGHRHTLIITSAVCW